MDSDSDDDIGIGYAWRSWKPPTIVSDILASHNPENSVETSEGKPAAVCKSKW